MTKCSVVMVSFEGFGASDLKVKKELNYRVWRRFYEFNRVSWLF